MKLSQLTPEQKTRLLAEGSKFGRLTAICVSGRAANRGLVWKFRCDCGTVKDISGASVKSGAVISCGCYHKQEAAQRQTRHSDWKSPEYNAWTAMRYRCQNPKHENWKDYGGRGISVCERWQSYKNFLADMGRRPSPKHTLDRIENNGNYEPLNCQWATMKQQSNNRRPRNAVLVATGKAEL